MEAAPHAKVEVARRSGWAPTLLLLLTLAVLQAACGNAERAPADASNAASADSALQKDTAVDANEPADVPSAAASDAQAPPPLKVYTIPPQLVVSEYLALDVPRAVQFKVCNPLPFAVKATLEFVPLGPTAVHWQGPDAFSLGASQTEGGCGKGGDISGSFKGLPPAPPVAGVLGQLIVRDDKQAVLCQVPVIAKPPLTAKPSGPVHFGSVYLGDGATQTVQLTNASGADIEVTDIALVSAPSNEFNWNFTDQTSGSLPKTLAPGMALALELSFHPAELAGKASRDLVLRDGVNELHRISLLGERAGSPCVPVWDPPHLQFGLQVTNLAQTTTISLINKGSHPCKLKSLAVLQCSGSACTQGLSGQFAVAGIPTEAFVLAPDEKVAIPIVAHAATVPSSGLAGETWKGVTGLIQATFTDLNDATVTAPAEWGKPNAFAVWPTGMLLPNPPKVELQQTPLGCPAQPVVTRFASMQGQKAELSDVSLVGCSGAFKLVGWPAPGQVWEAAMGQNFEIGVSWLPTVLGSDSCAVVAGVYPGLCMAPSGQPGALCAPGAAGCKGAATCVPFKAAVSLAGEATTGTMEEVFLPPAATAVDILVVVDGGEGMGPLQAAVSSTLVNALIGAPGPAWRVAVVAAQAPNGQPAGKLAEVWGANWVSPGSTLASPDGKKTPGESLAALVQVGSDKPLPPHGLASAVGAGLPPWYLAPQGVCPIPPAQCALDQVCIKLGPNLADSKCAGANWQALRSEARLEVIVVSNRDDKSTGEVEALVADLLGAKAKQAEKQVRIHSVVAEGVGCTGPYGTLQAAPRYIKAVALTGGSHMSACQSLQVSKFKGIANDALGPLRVLKLAKKPKPDLVAVSADFAPCPAESWTYDPALGAVVAPVGKGCATATATLTVKYVMACPGP